MREILFRGKRLSDCKWVTGYYINALQPGSVRKTGYYIVEYPGEWHEVFTTTVSQYTGIKDRKGNRIFEGDILEANIDSLFPENITRVSVEFLNGAWNIRQGKMIPDYLEESDGIQWEVVGNVFDNSELLKEDDCNGAD